VLPELGAYSYSSELAGPTEHTVKEASQVEVHCRKAIDY